MSAIVAEVKHAVGRFRIWTVMKSTIDVDCELCGTVRDLQAVIEKEEGIPADWQIITEYKKSFWGLCCCWGVTRSLYGLESQRLDALGITPATLLGVTLRRKE